jgi:hypothetical protein
MRRNASGECWCGCGGRTGNSFFIPGHDRVAESRVIKREYGGIVQFLEAKGYGPGKKSPRTGDRWPDASK